MAGSFLINDESNTDRWRTWVPSAVRLLEGGIASHRDLFETTATYAILRPIEHSKKRLHIRFSSNSSCGGYRSIYLHYEDGSNDTLQLNYDLGIPEGTIKIGQMESKTDFKARLTYIAAVLRMLMSLDTIAKPDPDFREDAATLVHYFHTPDGHPKIIEGEKMHIRLGINEIIMTGKAIRSPGSRISQTQLVYPKSCEMGRAMPAVIKAQEADSGLTTIFEPVLISGRGSTSPIDAMTAIANMSSLSEKRPTD